MFSKELQELDRNTVQLMIDEMREDIIKQKAVIAEQDTLISELKAALAQLQQQCPSSPTTISPQTNSDK